MMLNRSGFTLIELLVVMMIMALLAAGVSQVVNPSGSTAKRINLQGDKVFAQMNFALDDALVRYSALGIVLVEDENDPESTGRYSWHRYDGDNWQATQSPLGGHELDESLTWSIEVEQSPLEESLDDLLLKDDEAIQPVVVFYPSGEVSEFTMEISLSDEALQRAPEASDERYKITLNQRGQLQRYYVGEEEEEQ